MLGWLFKDVDIIRLDTLNMVANHSLKLIKYSINTCLITPTFISYHDFH